MIATLAGQRQLLVQTRDQLAGVNLADGNVLWRQPVEAFRGMNILTPTVWNGGIFTSSYGGKSAFLRILEKEGRWEVAEEWTNSVQAYMSTPVVVGGHAYVHLRNQRFACFDLSNGRQTWISDARYGQYWSLIAQNGKILALDEKGELLLLRADPTKFDLLDSRRVSDQPTWAHLSLSGGDLFIRELNGLSAFRWSQK
jgi:outer membrane protein assembly factor BamB